ncbi:hypothetical protein EYF80_060683 [Liparis tanakae]|uniref:Uncharacterized protein n=1 Tax=Liparis tanakae TaxID=230148 RepID=A0A4Z2EKQ9_9TELE|nr:hypothetical protein EYF80_060683 [Liparis tanakae]
MASTVAAVATLAKDTQASWKQPSTASVCTGSSSTANVRGRQHTHTWRGRSHNSKASDQPSENIEDEHREVGAQAQKDLQQQDGCQGNLPGNHTGGARLQAGEGRGRRVRRSPAAPLRGRVALGIRAALASMLSFRASPSRHRSRCPEPPASSRLQRRQKERLPPPLLRGLVSVTPVLMGSTLPYRADEDPVAMTMLMAASSSQDFGHSSVCLQSSGWESTALNCPNLASIGGVGVSRTPGERILQVASDALMRLLVFVNHSITTEMQRLRPPVSRNSGCFISQTSSLQELRMLLISRGHHISDLISHSACLLETCTRRCPTV